MPLTGEDHPPKYSFPSILGSRAPEHPVLVIKPHCLVRTMGVWLRRALSSKGVGTHIVCVHPSQSVGTGEMHGWGHLLRKRSYPESFGSHP